MNMTVRPGPGQVGDVSPAGPAWSWSVEEIQETVNAVRAGADLTPPSWPGGAQVAVALSFDVDQETIPLIAGDLTAGALSVGEYGSRVGMRRVLGLLAEFGVPATFFVPAVSALLHPVDLEACTEAGMEVALHGWIHERSSDLPAGLDAELLLRAHETLTKVSGQVPAGYRAPSANVTTATVEAIKELGLAYDSSLMADDEPYELLVDGQPSGIVELPMNWIRDDAVYFRFDRESALRPYLRPRGWLEVLLDEFDAAYSSGGMFSVVCHPHIIGFRSRMVVLRELLDHITSRERVWIATHAQIAAACQTRMHPNGDDRA